VLLLIDENVPRSVTEFLVARGHEVRLVTDILLPGTPDPVVAAVGDRLSATVVTWDRDFERLVERVPTGGKQLFRRLGRISFRCNEAHGRRLLEQWIDHIELHYSKAATSSDFRMIVQIQESGIKFM
jgi:predicted nuclease of predicted toxin-antitoxin system